MGSRLEGKVAVITGGASGLGLATVERFVEEGCAVVVVDLPPLTSAELAARVGNDAQAALHHSRRAPGGPNDGHAIAERLGDAVRFVPTDVTQRAQLAEAIDAAIRHFGGLDIMCNNAGILGDAKPIVEQSEDVWDRVIDVNLKAAWLGIKLAAPHIAARGGGSIISTASIAAISGLPGLAAYGASKAGVTGLTRTAALELAPEFIRVNAILPGTIMTPMVYDGPALSEAIDPDLIRPSIAQTQPLPRAGEAIDIANTALWLASEESSFVTGQCIVVDGGYTIEADQHMRPARKKSE